MRRRNANAEFYFSFPIHPVLLSNWVRTTLVIYIVHVHVSVHQPRDGGRGPYGIDSCDVNVSWTVLVNFLSLVLWSISVVYTWHTHQTAVTYKPYNRLTRIIYMSTTLRVAIACDPSITWHIPPFTLELCEVISFIHPNSLLCVW